MQVVLCDILTCRKEIPEGQLRIVTIMDKQYDLCKDCFDKFMIFIKEFLAPGTYLIQQTLQKSAEQLRELQDYYKYLHEPMWVDNTSNDDKYTYFNIIPSSYWDQTKINFK